MRGARRLRCLWNPGRRINRIRIRGLRCGALPARFGAGISGGRRAGGRQWRWPGEGGVGGVEFAARRPERIAALELPGCCLLNLWPRGRGKGRKERGERVKPGEGRPEKRRDHGEGGAGRGASVS